MTQAALQAPDTSCEATWLLRRADEGDCLVQLAVDKVTIGSGQSCTLRLTDEGVRPLHCLLTPGQEGPVVRRWSDGTLLNGEPFTEATMALGDRLTIGPVELVLDHPAMAESAPDTEPEEAYAGDGEESETWSDDATPESNEWTDVEEPAAEAEEEPAAHASRIQPLEASVRTNRTRARQLVQLARRQRLENEQLSADLANLQVRLVELEAERHQLTGERDDLRSQLGTLAHDMLEVREELNARTKAENERVAELEQRLTDLEQQISERDALVYDLREELLRKQEAAEVQQAASEPTESELPLQYAGEAEPTAIAQQPPEAAEVEPEAEPTPAPEPVSENLTERFVDWGAADEPEEATSHEEQPAEPARFAFPETEEPTAAADPISDYLWDADQHTEPMDDDPLNAEATPEPAPAGEGLWDIEVQTPKAVESAEYDLSEPEPAVAEESLTSTREPESPPEEPTTDPIATADTEPEAEGDVWGRLNSLRAAASEKLHHEVEHTEEEAEVAESLPDATDAGTEIDTPEAEQAFDPFQQPTDEPADEPAAEDSTSDDAWSSTTDATELEPQDESSVEPPTELLAEPQPEPLDEPVAEETPAVLPTTAFDAPPEPVKEQEEQVSFVERYKHLLEEEGNDLQPPAAETPAIEPPVPQPVAETPAGEEDGDESIEDYMAKMMARLRGESSPEPAPTANDSPKPAESSEVASAHPMPKSTESILARPNPLTSMLTAESAELAEPEKPLENLEEIKSAAKPEQATDMSSLRDLANSSAREAIKIANSRRHRELALSNLLMCATGAIGGAYLVWSSGGQLGLQMFCGAGAIAGAGFWALRTARAMSAPSAPKVKQPVQDDSSSELPIAGVEKH
ncbi:FHA domain-containing protein [Aeoliella sp.]|uniref:FHA domain-containing protein n=1 Tax=Aeoliella sp. TaxID=2795800 RepID=UPI003CCB7E82